MLDATRQKICILNDHYKKYDLESKHLSEEEHLISSDVLNKYKFIFDGTLGAWETKHVDIEPQSYAKPYHDNPYPLPRAHKFIFKK